MLVLYSSLIPKAFILLDCFDLVSHSLDKCVISEILIRCCFFLLFGQNDRVVGDNIKFCSMKITQEVRDFAVAKGLSEADALFAPEWPESRLDCI